MRTTITDIAKATGFSIATVSMILSGKDRRISESTREKVLAVAKELHYRPNQAAVNLKLGKSLMIGLLVPDISNEFYATLAKGIEESCSSRGFSLIVCNTSDKWEKELNYLNILESKGVDGIVFSPSSTTTDEKLDKLMQRLNEMDIPVIRNAVIAGADQISSVTSDSYMGGRIAAEHLYELGHRKVAVIAGPMHLIPARERLRGFCDVMKGYGFEVPDELIFRGDFSYECGLKMAGEVLSSGATAVFASNDMVALGLIHNLRCEGVRIPEDISVIGYDNILSGSIAEVGLTTIDQPTFELGLGVGKLLCDMIENKVMEGKRVVFEPTLLVRDSTGPVPAEN